MSEDAATTIIDWFTELRGGHGSAAVYPEDIGKLIANVETITLKPTGIKPLPGASILLRDELHVELWRIVARHCTATEIALLRQLINDNYGVELP